MYPVWACHLGLGCKSSAGGPRQCTVEERIVAVEVAEAEARHQLAEAAADGYLRVLGRLLTEVQRMAEEAATHQAAEAENRACLFHFFSHS